jgi:uncharacterized protein (DUF934 family)
MPDTSRTEEGGALRADASFARPAHLIRWVDSAPRIADNDWVQLDADQPWDGRPMQLLPLKLALASVDRLCAARPIGVWLAPTDDPVEAVSLFDRIDLIGVMFPTFTDGRGYSTATLLRTRHQWRGELRALGDVLQDQLFYMRRVGFNSFALRADRDPQKALKAFSTFSGTYQGSVSPDAPHFHRPSPPAPLPRGEGSIP